MLESQVSAVRLLAPAQVAEVLGVSVDEVADLVARAQLRGARVGSPARLRIEEQSVAEYLSAQIELERRMALWRQTSEASFPELWGTGIVKHAD
ncbi:helix-turn-helix domain-containing protein [Microbacterium ulmi]|uniref:Helix-turn-helix domain-containing protein n=1 Tax=Microbacterium ulmi TaxID=179095 RepID=A0A7Y2M2I3_9MICO|nr:helix-turn-helix domain-containing protein [Microbacterium ulmi]NII70417.1 excisionase family DNA binding protein [Microbacterium ulmi]NNH04982.1 helix-turn-helix domain-containing protein [Microbacterium ulmi]